MDLEFDHLDALESVVEMEKHEVLREQQRHSLEQENISLRQLLAEQKEELTSLRRTSQPVVLQAQSKKKVTRPPKRTQNSCLLREEEEVMDGESKKLVKGMKGQIDSLKRMNREMHEELTGYDKLHKQIEQNQEACFQLAHSYQQALLHKQSILDKCRALKNENSQLREKIKSKEAELKRQAAQIRVHERTEECSQEEEIGRNRARILELEGQLRRLAGMVQVIDI